MLRIVLALALGACATMDPFADIASAQTRLDRRSLDFSVARAAGDAFVLRPRGEGGLNADPMVAALAAAPRRCRVETITAQEEGAAYRVDYDC